MSSLVPKPGFPALALGCSPQVWVGTQRYSPGVRQHRAFRGGLAYPEDPRTDQTPREETPRFTSS